ncbi:hypothetical protein BJ322DRAFT_1091625 [Thelephora terrestris]|uniref:Uncharacterized protein n=1 Tax=Thelephora terrestris TaxID=56493 RepID=A0A9P6H4A2_9AGAM|nr:hypothetical protein BJ322DRAFT_1091625 [Thelephora terrestris]
MTSTFCDSHQDPPLLCWTDDGPSSPARSLFTTRYSVRHASELSPAPSPSNVGSRSPSEKDFGRWDIPMLPTGTGGYNFLSPGVPNNYLHKRRFSVGPIREDADIIDDFNVDGVCHYEDPSEVGLEENLETEIDGLLEALTDYHSKRVTMSSAPLLPLPEELSPTGGTASPQLYFDSPLPQLVTASTLFGSDPDTPPLTSSSPRSSKGSYFSPTKSPSLKSKRSFTPITPSTDGWRSPPSLATVPERKASTSDYLGREGHPGHSEACSTGSPGIPEYFTRERSLSISSETRRAHHTNLPPIRTVIPEDSFLHRRGKDSISSEITIMDDHRNHVESQADQSLSSRFSDDDASEMTETGYLDPGFDHVYLSNSSAVPTRSAQPDVDSPYGPGALGGRYSPTSSISLGFVGYPPPINVRSAPSPKRRMFQSLFSHNSSSKELKRPKGRDPIKTQPPTSQPVDARSFATSSSKSSSKEKKRVEKAEKRAQLAAQLRAKELQQTKEADRGTSSRATASKKALAAWEEGGAMYSMDGIF